MAAHPKPGKISFRWVMMLVLLVTPVYLLFDYVGRGGNGKIAALGLGMLALAVRVRWELSGNIWLWVTVVLIAIAHLPLIFLVPWSSGWMPAAVLFPFCALDGLAILGIIQLVEKWMSR